MKLFRGKGVEKLRESLTLLDTDIRTDIYDLKG
jgi:hypothetical protein